MSAPQWALVLGIGLALIASLGPLGLGIRRLWELLALAGAAAAMAAVDGHELSKIAFALAILTVLDVLISVRGRRAPLAWLVGLGSVGLWWWAAQLRVQAGGESVVEWWGMPFSGDTPATLAFLSLAIPLALPGFLGGVWAGLSSGPIRNRAGRLGYGLTGCLRPLAYASLLATTFGGSEVLIHVGLVLLWIAPVVALFQHCADERLSTLAMASLWALIGAQGVATMRAEDAFALGLLGWVVPVVMLSATLAFLRGEQQKAPGLAPLGLARLFPLTYWMTLLAAAAAAGAPFLGAFHGRARSAGAMERYGNGEEALGYALAAAPLFALIAMPWIRYVFFSRASSSSLAPPPRRSREPAGLLLGLGLGVAANIALGLTPELAQGLLPHGDMTPVAFPSQLGQLQLLLGACIVASFFKHRVDSVRLKLSSTP